MSQVNKKVLQVINENKISIKDIYTRSKYWEKPVNEITLPNGVKQKEENLDYRDLVIYTKWKWWQPSYKFLPTPDKFVEIKEQFLKEEWGILEKQNYYITRSKNNQFTVILQNRGQYDFADPRIVIFFGRNTLNPECKAKQEKAGRKGVEYPSFFFITSWDYINTKNLLVQLTIQKDPIWANYGDMMNSKGRATITNSQFNNDHLNKEGKVISQKEHFPADQDYQEQSAHNCPACDNCYDFCGDLRNKRAVPVGYSSPTIVKSWQPSFALLYSYTPAVTARTHTSSFVIVDEQNNPVCTIPSNIKLRKWKEEVDVGNFLSDASKPCLLFIVDSKHEATGSLDEAKPFSSPVRHPSNDKDGYLWEELPKCYAEQHHLLNHSSAQFYFQKKVLFTANLKHLHVRRKGNGFVLGYRILIRSSIAGILYCFESGDIFYKWEVKVKGSVINESLITKLTSSVLMGFVKKRR